MATTARLSSSATDRDRRDADAARGADTRPSRTLIEQWARIGGVCGVLAMAVYGVGSAAELTTTQEAVVAVVFGPSIVCASMGLYHVLRLRRRTVSLDLGLIANVAAGVTVTLMLMAQVGMKGWFELEFGEGATESTERTLRAAFEAANGIQLGLDVAWDVFLVIGSVLLAVNMWFHPRFGRVIASAGIALAVGLMVINLATFPEPPDHAGALDLGPFVGSWYLIVSVRLLTSGRWIADHEATSSGDRT